MRRHSGDIMRTLLIHGYHFSVADHRGTGVPILMLSSTGLDPRQWRALRRAMPTRTTHGLYYLGYPPSDAWGGAGDIDITLDFQAAEALLLEQTRPVDLLGHSYGGYLALQLAVKHPDRVRRIVVHEPTSWGCLWESDRRDLKADFEHIVSHFFSHDMSPEHFLQRFIDYWNAPGVWAGMPEHRKEGWRYLAPKVMAEVRMLCFDTTPSTVYSELPHPVTMTVGADTPPHEAEVCRILNEAIPKCSKIDVPGGHLGVVTHATSVLPHLLKALESPADN